jgi:hypothetical protein
MPDGKLPGPYITPTTDVRPIQVDESGAVDPLIGETPLGKYRIKRKLGAGRFSTAYLAEQRGEDPAVIEVLHDRLIASRDFEKRFEREAPKLAKLADPHLLRFFGHGRLESGRYFLAREHGGEKSLADELSEPLQPGERIQIAMQVLGALAAAHSAGVVHGDLKPANVFVVGAVAKLANAGVARLLERLNEEEDYEKIADDHTLEGTLAYVSPEQELGMALDERSDVYSLGLLLQELLAPLGEAVPVKTRLAIETALQREPEDRFANAEEMLEALQPGSRRARPARSIALGAVLGVAVLTGLFLALRPRNAVVTLSVSPETAELAIDGQRVAAGAVKVRAGHHVLCARARGYDPQTTELELAAGEKRPLLILLTEAPAEAPPPFVGPPRPEELR